MSVWKASLFLVFAAGAIVSAIALDRWSKSPEQIAVWEAKRAAQSEPALPASEPELFAGDPQLAAKRRRRAELEAQIERAKNAAAAAELRKTLAARFETADWLAQAPGVTARLRGPLARISAELVVQGICTESDFRYWSWGESGRAGQQGEWFTYCRSGAGHRRIYADPASGTFR